MKRRETRCGDLPLIEWGEQLRRRQAVSARRSRRIWIVGALVAATGSTIAIRPAPRLVWNASASAPVGLYRVSPGSVPRRGAMVIAWTPSAVRSLAAARGYIPANLPLVKRVAAVPGDTVCAHDNVLLIEDRPVAIRAPRDRQGRKMPWWSGCQLLREGDVFLLMPGASASFDGRYFGVSRMADVIGVARPIWLR